jgi:hypothetical protein
MPVREWAPVLSTSLGWLMGALEPRVGPFRETMQRWSSVSSADYAVVAEDVAQRLLASGRAFQRMIDTPEKLASVLTKLPEFPGAANGAGPGSIAPHEYAAVLYRDLGDRRAALAVLERGTVELLNRDATDEEAEAVISCRTAKYRDWIAAH